MADLYVDQVMSRPAETVAPDTPVGDAAAAMIEHDVGALVVVDDGLAGLLTATDFVLQARDGSASPDATVGEWMRTDVVTAERRDPVHEVADVMLDRLIHHVPVVDGDEVVGMVTTLDLTAVLARRLRP
ncbi:CBS domain-containing protein [Halorarius halobius]|uniref:CBS domain-containing protein n=1 Tax=Halorarius halobius TaxID=2962671 RepID=UPI0020CF71CA|nr:CBS domain-containing protein [Halorarius halobius]